MIESRASYVCREDQREELNARLLAVLPGDNFRIDRDAARLMHIAAQVLRVVLGRDFEESARAFGRGELGPVFRFENMPTPGTLPETPVSGQGGDREVLLADALLLGVYKLAGIDPVAYQHENNGRLIRNVVANPAEAHSMSSHGSKHTFPWHTDNPAQRFEFESGDTAPAPKYLGFSGLRNADASGCPVTTDVLDLNTILAAIPAQVIGALIRPEFRVRPPASNQKSFVLEGVPLLVYRPRTGVHLRFEYDICEGLTSRASEALEAFNDVLDTLPFDAIDLQAGDHLIFENSQVVHRRVGFDPGELAVSRWLRRCYGCGGIGQSQVRDPEDHPFLWG